MDLPKHPEFWKWANLATLCVALVLVQVLTASKVDGDEATRSLLSILATVGSFMAGKKIG